MLSTYGNGPQKLDDYTEMSQLNKEKTLSTLQNYRQIDQLVNGIYLPESIKNKMRKDGSQFRNKRMANELSLRGIY